MQESVFEQQDSGTKLIPAHCPQVLAHEPVEIVGTVVGFEIGAFVDVGAEGEEVCALPGLFVAGIVGETVLG